MQLHVQGKVLVCLAAGVLHASVTRISFGWLVNQSCSEKDVSEGGTYVFACSDCSHEGHLIASY
eukprot:6196934-Pleurochrysis_carterae.AAC.3